MTADRLTVDAVKRYLHTRWLGQELHCFDAVDSTNTVARDLGRAGAADGTVVIAEAQSQGRGRLGRTWASPAYKNLYASIVLRAPLPTEQVPQISLLAGVATCDAVREWHPAKIKWPNDVLIDGRKVAGILAEMENDREIHFVVLGIGINLNTELDDFTAELRDKAVSLQLATGAPVDRARLAGRLLTQVENWYDKLRDEGFGPIAAAWRTRSDLIGRAIRVQEAERAIVGEVIDLDNDGALRVRLESGAEQRIVAGDVTVIDGYG